MNYVFIGHGRLASHMAHYLSSLGHKVSVWSRRSTKDLNPLIEKADVICLSTRDQEISGVIKAYGLNDLALPIVHFSGSQSIEGTFGFHPLMTFGPELYDKSEYKDMHFIGSPTQADFEACFPKLKNTYQQISANKLALYHTYCSMAGNFPQILWSEVSQKFKEDLGLEPEALKPYIKQISKNFIRSGNSSVTGPLVRNDNRTLVRHLDALTKNRLQGIYFSFVNLFQKKQIMENSHESRGISSKQI